MGCGVYDWSFGRVQTEMVPTGASYGWIVAFWAYYQHKVEGMMCVEL